MKLTSSWPPARVEGRVRAALHATTSAGPAGPAGPAGKYKKADFWIQFREFDTFLGKGRPIFNKIANVAQGLPKESQRGLKGGPKGSKGAQRTPRLSPRALQRVKKEAKVGPGGAKGVPKTPKGGQRKPKGKIYIKKLPINRPSGRYVTRLCFQVSKLLCSC